jgi:hypothetical protein
MVTQVSQYRKFKLESGLDMICTLRNRGRRAGWVYGYGMGNKMGTVSHLGVSYVCD